MYDLYYWPTPNGHKVTLFMEEAGLPYRIVPVDIANGEQFAPAFLKISPNNRMPALVDTESGVSVFESGAILVYLAEKHGVFLPTSGKARVEVLEWLFWQMGGLGPMIGQANHFSKYAPDRIPYAVDRYQNEGRRLMGVLDRRLDGRPFVAGDGYSIADMAIYPWARTATEVIEGLDVPQVSRWLKAVGERPATVRAYAIADEPRFKRGPLTEEQRRILFNQSKPDT